MIVLIIVVVMVAWIGGIFLLIPDRPRAWDYGAVPEVPGESRFSTQQPPAGTLPPPQVPSVPTPKPVAP